VRRPFVAGWSTGDGVGSLQLRRTVEAAVRKEAGTNPGGARATSQWARLAFPVTVGEQGPLVAADLPTALMSVSGERSPPAADPIVRNPPRLQPFGRAALRTLTALDNAPTLARARPCPGHLRRCCRSGRPFSPPAAGAVLVAVIGCARAPPPRRWAWCGGSSAAAPWHAGSRRWASPGSCRAARPVAAGAVQGTAGPWPGAITRWSWAGSRCTRAAR
jgi:hypothetical protein